VKLLLDENLSPRLVLRLSPLFSGLTHVREVGLKQAQDENIWEWAKAIFRCGKSKICCVGAPSGSLSSRKTQAADYFYFDSQPPELLVTRLAEFCPAFAG
jgi:hypothetical protein